MYDAAEVSTLSRSKAMNWGFVGGNNSLGCLTFWWLKRGRREWAPSFRLKKSYSMYLMSGGYRILFVNAK